VNLIRCFGMSEKALIGVHIAKLLRAPSVISLHGNPDKDYFRGRRATTLKLRLKGLLSLNYEKYIMQNYSYYIGVYNAIRPYFEKFSIENFSIIYNDVSTSVKKINKISRNHGAIEIINVGRQDYLEKNPKNIIHAVTRFKNLNLTLIGNGSLHEDLITLVQELRLESRVKLITNLPNEEVLLRIAKSDIYVYHSQNSEVSKSCMEAALLGVPVIVNFPENNLSTEINAAGFIQVIDSPEGYASGIGFVLANLEKKDGILKITNEFSKRNWDSEVIKDQYLKIYTDLNI